jgi:hypothetical protein
MSDTSETTGQDPTATAPPPQLQAAAEPAPATSSRKGRVRLDRLAHVRRQLATVYRDLASWNPSGLKASEKIARARCLGLLLGQVGEVVRHSDLETRLARLEDAIRGAGPTH